MALPRFVLHHAPQSRSDRIVWLMEEARASYEVVRHDLRRGTQKEPAFLAINPFGKVPAIEDRGPEGDWRGVVVTESEAICAYVADVLPDANLAPPVGSPLRAAYATWMSYCPSVLEPAFTDQVFPRAAEVPRSSIGWPEFPQALARIEQTLAGGGPYLLGDTFSAADVMVGSLLQWIVMWGKAEPGPAVARYLGALEAREAYRRARAAAAA